MHEDLYVSEMRARRKQHSGETLSMRKLVHFLAAAGNFPRKNFQQTIGNNCYEKN